MDENTKEKTNEQSINVNVEIDYDKLAMAIVKAQEMTKSENVSEEKHIPVWKKIIGLFLPFQKHRKEEMTVRFFAFIVGGLCWVIGLIGLFLFIPAVCIGFESISAFVLSGENLFWRIYNGILTATLLILFFALLILLTGMGAEITNSDDKHFVVSVFSAMTSLVALIVAFVALS